MKNYYKSLILVFISVLFFSACKFVENDPERKNEKLAENVVEQFHRYYNEQNYEEIFNAAHQDAKRTKSKEALGLALATAFEKFGKYMSSELVFKRVQPINTNERQVEFVYKSKFENGERNETFLIITNEQKGALYGIGELTDAELEKLQNETKTTTINKK